jgi:hypothetical protein
MTIPTRPLFLAGLLLAAACSDAGTPVAAGDRGASPVAAPDDVLAVLTCSVDVRAGTEMCAPARPETGGAPGALIAIGNATYITLTTTNVVSTPTALSYDRTLTNNAAQALGTIDGINAHATGVRVWLEPFSIDTAVAGQPTSVTVANADGILTFKTFKNRPYFQYPGLLQPGATSITRNWQFALQNVDAFSYTVFVLSEVQFPKGWIDVTPMNPAVGLGDADTLAAHVRAALGQLYVEPQGLTWTSSDPSVVTVMELVAPDTLAQITAVSPGSAWIKARSSAPADSLARRDSVLVTVP